MQINTVSYYDMNAMILHNTIMNTTKFSNIKIIKTVKYMKYFTST